MHSVHLECPRKEAFRAARAALLQACGEHTVMFNSNELPSELSKLSPKGPVDQLPTPPVLEQPKELPTVLINDSQRRTLKVGHNTIGRLTDNDIVSNDGFMSRRHCAILVHTNLKCELHDLASKNGTFLNGIRIKESVTLKPGDVIQLGDVRIMFMGQEGASSGASQAKPKDQTCVLPE